MSPLDALLKESLTSIGREYDPMGYAEARAEFLSRRRRRRWMTFAASAATAAAVGISVILAVDVLAPSPDREVAPVATRMSVVAEIPVGTGPEAVAVDAGSVWVANTKAGTVSKLDVETNALTREIPIDGNPDEVIAGAEGVWITTQEGDVARLDPVTGDPTLIGSLGTGDEKAFLDIALGAGSAWVAAPSTELGEIYRIDPEAGKAVLYARFEDLGLTPRDVATTQQEVWLLDGRRGVVERIFRFDHPRRRIPLNQWSSNADLVAGFDALWVALGDSGRVLRIDVSSGEITNVTSVGGTRIDLAVGDEEVWAVVVGEGSTGTLYRLDPATGGIVGQPLEIQGTPVDVTFGEGAAWVVSSTTDTLTRVEPTR